jgi:hypothetical protein
MTISESISEVSGSTAESSSQVFESIERLKAYKVSIEELETAQEQRQLEAHEQQNLGYWKELEKTEQVLLKLCKLIEEKKQNSNN